MRRTRDARIRLTVIFMTLSLGLVSCRRMERTNAASPPVTQATPAADQSVIRADLASQRRDAEQQVRPYIERQRSDIEQQAQKDLDKEAIAAIEETRRAIQAIAQNNTTEALAAIDRANKRIETLLTRNPSTALLPVAVTIEVVDTAPIDLQAIRDRANAVAQAIRDRNYPAARALLYLLMSEIHVRTDNLPLASYPAALKDAARLLDLKQNREAETVLLTALNTLVEIDRSTPIPLLVAQAAIDEAETMRATDRNRARKLLAVARTELQRANELGYAANDPEYAALDKAISDLETQLNGNADTTSFFTRLKERLATFFKRLSQGVRH